MERKAFQLLHDAESSWWYRGRANVVARVLLQFATRSSDNTVLDIGSGWGGMFSTLSSYGKIIALEPDTEAQTSCSARRYTKVYGMTDLATLEKEKHDLVGLFDVLEHVEDDAQFLTDIHRTLTKDGVLILTVPAFAFLWSNHDVTHHHYRRYSRAQLTALLAREGFHVTYASYWNMTLFFPTAITRLLGRSGESALQLPHLLDAIFYFIIRIESFFIPSLALPFGTGIIIFSRKQS